MDKNQKNRKETLSPSPLGLRRSATLGNVPPLLPPPREGGSDSASERKRPRLHRKEEGKGHREEVRDPGSGDVNVSVQHSPKKVDPSLAGSGDGGGCSEDGGRGQNNEMAQSKAGGTIGQLDQAAVPSPGVRRRSAVAATAEGGSEVKSSETLLEEEPEAHPCLFIESVLDVVMKHIVAQPGPRTVMTADVRNIRLVCKTWRTSVTRLYRQTRPAKVFYRYDQRGNPNHRDRLRLYTLTNFMKTMTPSPMIPVQKFKFMTAVFLRKNLKMFREFLLLCGPEVVELSISVMTSDTENIMLNLNPENLRSLEMTSSKH